MGLKTKINIIYLDEILELSAFENICTKCANKKVKNWKKENNFNPKGSNGNMAFWMSLYPEHEEKIKNREKGKGSLDHFLKRGKSEEDWLQKNIKLSVGEETYLRKGFSKEEIEKRKKQHAEKSSLSLDSYIKKYGKEEGVKKFQQLREKVKSVRNPEYWLRIGLSLSEAKEKIKQLQTRDLNFFIRKHGEQEGLLKFQEFTIKRIYATTKEGYIERLGEEEGLKAYSNRVKTISYGQTLEFYINKYGENEGLLKFQELTHKRVFNSGFSKVSSKFQEQIENYFLSLVDETEKVYCSLSTPFYIHILPKEKQELKCSHFSKRLIIPDIRYYNLIIEADGDYWHGEEGNELDTTKDKFYNLYGFKVLRIKEHLWNKETDLCKQNILNFLKHLDKNFKFQSKFYRGINYEN